MSSSINVTIKQDSTSLVTDPNTPTPTNPGDIQNQNNGVKPPAGNSTVVNQGDSIREQEVGAKDKPKQSQQNKSVSYITKQPTGNQQLASLSMVEQAMKNVLSNSNFVIRDRSAIKK